MNTNNQCLAPLRNVTIPGERRENHFDTDRSGRSVAMPKISWDFTGASRQSSHFKTFASE